MLRLHNLFFGTEPFLAGCHSNSLLYSKDSTMIQPIHVVHVSLSYIVCTAMYVCMHACMALCVWPMACNVIACVYIYTTGVSGEQQKQQWPGMW